MTERITNKPLIGALQSTPGGVNLIYGFEGQGENVQVPVGSYVPSSPDAPTLSPESSILQTPIGEMALQQFSTLLEDPTIHFTREEVFFLQRELQDINSWKVRESDEKLVLERPLAQTSRTRIAASILEKIKGPIAPLAVSLSTAPTDV